MSRSQLAQTRVNAIRLIVFALVSVLLTGALSMIMGNISFEGNKSFRAVFSDASSVAAGDGVRVAGITVGKVTGVEQYQGSKALVSFEVEKDLELTSGTRVAVRFLNLVGSRYLALEQGDAPGAVALPDGALIPEAQTQPALNLTSLFNGFRPLFMALEPQQVNKLSMNLVRVLQGEGGTISSLLRHTASLTDTLADRDELIGQVITNLQGTLTTVNSNRQQLSRLITGLRGWMTQLARSRSAIGASIDNIADLVASVASLAVDIRGPLKADLKALRDLAGLLNEPQNRAQIVDMLDKLPGMMARMTRTGTYGSWYNYYICGFVLKIQLPAQIAGVPVLGELAEELSAIKVRSQAPRCASG